VDEKCETKPIIAFFGLKMRVTLKNKANFERPGADHAARLARGGWPVVRNKANFQRPQMNANFFAADWKRGVSGQKTQSHPHGPGVLNLVALRLCVR
jgi:hypothetical protein